MHSSVFAFANFASMARNNLSVAPLASSLRGSTAEVTAEMATKAAVRANKTDHFLGHNMSHSWGDCGSKKNGTYCETAAYLSTTLRTFSWSQCARERSSPVSDCRTNKSSNTLLHDRPSRPESPQNENENAGSEKRDDDAADKSGGSGDKHTKQKSTKHRANQTK